MAGDSRLELLRGVLQRHAVAAQHQPHQRRVAAAHVRHLAEPLATQRLAAWDVRNPGRSQGKKSRRLEKVIEYICNYEYDELHSTYYSTYI